MLILFFSLLTRIFTKNQPEETEPNSYDTCSEFLPGIFDEPKQATK